MTVAGSGCDVLVDLGPERSLAPSAPGGGQGGHGGSGGADGGSAAVGCPGEGPVAWMARFGDAADQYSRVGIEDGEGGIFIAGSFAGVLDLGGSPMASAGGHDLFLARFDADGRHLWSRSLGGEEDRQSSLALARAPDGGVVIGGEMDGTIDFGHGPVTAAGSDEGFVARYAADGEHLWTRIFGGPGRQEVQGVGVDPRDGTVYATGPFYGTMEVDGHFFTATPCPECPYVTTDIFLIQLDADGRYRRDRTAGGSGEDGGGALAVDPSGRVIFGGSGNSSTIELGGEPLAGTEGDALAALYDPQLQAIWTDRYYGTGTQAVRHVAIAATADVLLGGRLTGMTAFGDTTVMSDGFLAWLAADGTARASRGFSGITDPTALRFGRDGVWLSAPFGGTTDIAGGSLASMGGTDAIIVHFDDALEPRWSFRFGSTGNDTVGGLAVDERSQVLAVGHFHGTIDIEGCGPLASAGGADLFLLKLRP
jgi:hypothetical protein